MLEKNEIADEVSEDIKTNRYNELNVMKDS